MSLILSPDKISFDKRHDTDITSAARYTKHTIQSVYLKRFLSINK